MGVREDMDAGLKQAMRDKDTIALEALRAVRAAVKKFEIDTKKEYKDEDILGVIQKAIKQRQDSIESFKAGNRADLVAKEEAEMEVLKKYLPAQLDEAAVALLVEEAVKATGAAGPKDMGKVMGALMPRVKGKADGQLVNRLVKARLGS
jgi:uncharacterized protein